MTPIHSATSADNQQIWPDRLRIREAVQTTSAMGRPVPHKQMLHAALEHLQAGWRWVERKRALQLTSRRLRVSETISLGEKRSVSIVQVDGAQFLIGCSTASVQLLAVLDKQQDAAMGPLQKERAS